MKSDQAAQLLVLVSGVGLMAYTAYLIQREPKIPELEPKDYEQYALIHRPNKGCPSGWSELPGVFHERDGRKEDGCWNPAYEKRVDDRTIHFSMDVLKAGESCCYHPGEPVVKEAE